MSHETHQHPVLAGFKFLSTLVVLTTLFWVCNSGGEQQKEEIQAESAGFQMNCVRLTKAQVQAWVDSGWTKPGDPDNRIKKILLQFYTGNAENAGTNMQLVAFPGKNYLQVYQGGRSVLEIDTICKAKSLTGNYVLGNTYASFDLLKITNPDGTLIDFDFVRFIPAQTYPPYLNFTMEVVKQVGTQETTLSKDESGTDPCPPLCP